MRCSPGRERRGGYREIIVRPRCFYAGHARILLDICCSYCSGAHGCVVRVRRGHPARGDGQVAGRVAQRGSDVGCGDEPELVELHNTVGKQGSERHCEAVELGEADERESRFHKVARARLDNLRSHAADGERVGAIGTVSAADERRAATRASAPPGLSARRAQPLQR